MPQISQIDSFVSQIFWLFLSFGIIYFYISKIAGPKLTSVIMRRQNIISTDIETAEKANEDADKSRNEYTSKLEESKKQAGGIIVNASEEIAKSQEQAFALLAADTKQQIANAEKEIKAAKEQAEESLSANSIDFIEAILEKIAGTKVDRETIAKYLEK